MDFSLVSHQSNADRILELIKKSKTAFVFGHDDVDGITSASILTLMLKKMGLEVHAFIPNGFILWKEQWNDALKRAGVRPDVVFITDKGTLKFYETYIDVPIVIVDHHQIDVASDKPERAVIVNPTVEFGKKCSASSVCYVLYSYFVGDDDFPLFLAGLGLQGDIVDESNSDNADFVRQIYKMITDKNPNLWTRKDRGMLDLRRDYSTEYRRMAEFLAVLLGAGHMEGFKKCHWKKPLPYNGLQEEIFQILLSSEEKFSFEKVDLSWVQDRFRDYQSIYAFFLREKSAIEDVVRRGLVKAFKVDGVVFHLLTAREMIFLPIIASAVFDLEDELKSGDGESQHALILVNFSDRKAGISLRGVSKVNLGILASRVARKLRGIFGVDLKEVSGGGHPMAAEISVSDPETVPLAAVLNLIYLEAIYTFPE